MKTVGNFLFALTTCLLAFSNMQAQGTDYETIDLSNIVDLEYDWWRLDDGYIIAINDFGARGVPNVTIKGNTNVYHIKILCDSATITLENASIDMSANADSCAFDLNGKAVKLILKGNNTLKSRGNAAGLQVMGTARLTISGEPDGTLNVSGDGGAGIGGASGYPAGTITINGGNINAQSSVSAGGGAAIGGGWQGDGGSITINGGSVSASYGASGNNAALIGGGGSNGASYTGGQAGTITINGGTVGTNVGNRQITSIGSGGYPSDYNNAGRISINGGTVSVNGYQSAAIGGGNHGNGGTININGGEVTANCLNYGSGIGGGRYGHGGNITISGGIVIATCTNGSGIGAGCDVAVSNLDNINISGGKVTAICNGSSNKGQFSTGIGGNTTITGGTVYAHTPGTATAIGGNTGNASVNISGGVVVATTSNSTTPGIGKASPITISGGTVIANGTGIQSSTISNSPVIFATAISGHNSAPLYGIATGTHVSITPSNQGREGTITLNTPVTVPTLNLPNGWEIIKNGNTLANIQAAIDSIETKKDDELYWTVAHTDANNADEVKEWLATQINAIPGMSETGVTVMDTNIIINIDPAITGWVDNLDGIEGKFDFSVRFGIRSGFLTTEEIKDCKITTTPYVRGNYSVTPNVSGPGGVSPFEEFSFWEGDTVTFTSEPSGGYRTVFVAHKRNEPDTVVSMISNTGDTHTFRMPHFDVTVEVTFTKTQELIDIEDVQLAITNKDSTYWTVDQATAVDADAVKNWLVEQVNLILPEKGVTRVIDDVSIISPATSGWIDNLNGIDGSFTFKVKLTKNGIFEEKTITSGKIKATFYERQYFSVTSISSSGHGSVAVPNQASVLEGDTITLTIIPEAGYELDSIFAHKTNYTDTVVQLNSTGVNTRTFRMPCYNVKVTSAFKKAQILLDIEEARDSIEAQPLSYWTVDQVIASNENAVEGWLAGPINTILERNGKGVTVTDITVGDFNEATTGTLPIPFGGNGGFSFTVTLTKNGVSRTTAPQIGEITATPYEYQYYAATIGNFANGEVTRAATGNIREHTTVTLTIAPTAGYELDSIFVHKTGDPAVIVPFNGAEGNTRTFIMPSYPVTVKAAFKKTQATLNAEAVEAAKGLIEAKGISYWTVAKATANTENAVKEWLATQINAIPGMSETGVTVANITFDDFYEAVAGTLADPDGEPGSFSFVVQLAKGSAEGVTSKTGEITTTPYEYQYYAVNIGEFFNGVVTRVPATGNIREDSIVTLAITPAVGYELDSIFAHKTDYPAVIVPLNGTGGNTRTFIMPSYPVTVKAAFKKTQDLLDVEAAIGLVLNQESSYWTVAHATAGDAATVKNWLAGKINDISGMSETGVTVEDIIVVVSLPATAGTLLDPDGEPGSFTFSVWFKKEDAFRHTGDRTGTITATPYEYQYYAVTIGDFANGTVTRQPATGNIREDSIVTLTGTPTNDGYKLGSISVHKTGETGTVVPLDSTNVNTRTFTMPSFDVTVTAVFTETQNLLDIETAIGLIEEKDSLYWTVAQATANTPLAVKGWLVERINAISNLSGTGVTTVDQTNININNVTPATAGVFGNLNGDPGSFTFTVTLTKNGVSRATKVQSGTITATLYVLSRSNVTASADNNGSVTSDKTSQVLEGDTVTLTIVPVNDGYELNSIFAHKTGDTGTVVPINGTGNTRTFRMPSFPVTVTASFKKTQNLLDIETAIGLIEAEDASYWTVLQATANNESEVKEWLATQINAIPGMSETGVTIADTTVNVSPPATAGTLADLDGGDGSFSFSVQLAKEYTFRGTSGTGAITATPYEYKYYAVTIGDFANGAVTLASTTNDIREDTTVTLSIAPANDGYELDSIFAHKTGDTGTIVPLDSTEVNARTFTMPSFDVTVTAAFKKTQNLLDIETAIGLIEDKDSLYWIVAQTTANNADAVKGWLVGRINAITGMSETGVTMVGMTNINIDVTPATAGVFGNLPGTHGSFTFTVTLTKNGVSRATKEQSGTITATLYVLSHSDVNVSSSGNGLVTSNKTSQVLEGDTVTLTITPANDGYELDSIFAYKTGETGTIVPLDSTGVNTRTFTMPSFDVTVTAAFKKTQNLLAVETAIGLIKAKGDSYWTVLQATANTESEVKGWLAGQIYAIPGIDETGVTVTNITVGDFNGATAGTLPNPDGDPGSFNFTVRLAKGNVFRDTENRTGAITETPYEYRYYTVTVGDFANGAVTLAPTTGSIREETTVTLTIAPDNGCELDSIFVRKTGDTGTTVPLDSTEVNTRTFKMPSFPVTVTAAFKKTPNLLAVETAIGLIEAQDASYWTVLQTTANNESEVKGWLVAHINAIAGMSETGVTIADTIVEVNPPATAGTLVNLNGVPGSFTFAVRLAKGDAFREASGTGAISATPYVPNGYNVNINPSGNGEVTSNPASIAVENTTVTLTITPTTGYELDSISVRKTDDTGVTVSLDSTGVNARTFTMPSFSVTVTAAFKKTQATLNAEAVEAAKSLVEDKDASYWTVAQTTANTESEVKGWLVAQINAISGMSETGVTVTTANITVGDFNGATAGTLANPDGDAGSFTFAVRLAKGEAFREVSGTGAITATPYEYQYYTVTIGDFANGAVTPDPTTGSIREDTTVTLAIAPANDYELETISVHKTGDTGSIVPLDSTEVNTRTFKMPSFPVTVAAAFKKTQNLLDVETAIGLIEAKDASYWTVLQATANNESEVKEWLAGQVNAILNTSATGITVTTANITVGDFNGATAGVYGNLPGTPGSFTFTVTLTKNDVSRTTENRTGTITAIPYVPQTGVILDPPSAILTVGATLDLTATVEPGNATHQAVSWHSSNPAVADTLSTGGLTAVVTAKAAGDAWIIATTIDGNLADSCLVRVPFDGTCGVNLRWTLLDSVLTVSGSGAMEDYEISNSAPWYAHHNAIKSIVVEGEVTHIGSSAFYAEEYSNLTSVTIGDSVKSIGNYAFGLCTALTSVTNLRLSPQTIDANVFDGVDLSGVMLYVSAGGSRRSYLKAAVWKEFKKARRVGITEPNSDATLGDLAISSGDRKFPLVPQFFPGKTDYTLSVENSVSSVTVSATPNDPEAIIVSGDDLWQLTTGNNILEVVVEAENEDRKIYTVTVTRELNTDIPSVAEPVEAVEAQVYLYRQNLYIDSPVAERIAVYSLTGALLYNFEKPVGKASFTVASTASTASTGSAAGFASTGSAARMLIVKGSSGWVRKLAVGH